MVTNGNIDLQSTNTLTLAFWLAIFDSHGLIETTEQGKCAFTEKKALKKEDSRFELFKTLKIWKWTF